MSWNIWIDSQSVLVVGCVVSCMQTVHTRELICRKVKKLNYCSAVSDWGHVPSRIELKSFVSALSTVSSFGLRNTLQLSKILFTTFQL